MYWKSTLALAALPLALGDDSKQTDSALVQKPYARRALHSSKYTTYRSDTSGRVLTYLFIKQSRYLATIYTSKAAKYTTTSPRTQAPSRSTTHSPSPSTSHGPSPKSPTAKSSTTFPRPSTARLSGPTTNPTSSTATRAPSHKTRSKQIKTTIYGNSSPTAPAEAPGPCPHPATPKSSTSSALHLAD